ncbi:MAG: hypothetical protein HY390_06515 [Deltaproteobacteria bacterium]|nr:hypothetical protein [Deltaproteobacteria bacterium]
MGKVVLKNKKVPYILAGAGFLFLLIYILWIYVWAWKGAQFKLPRLGMDSCMQCGMIVNDLRFSVAVQSADRYGNIQTIFFDDIGCFFNHAVKHSSSEWKGMVWDFETKEQVDILKAFYVRTQIQTPMGSGWIVRKNQTSDSHGVSFQNALTLFQQGMTIHLSP